jgi:hypothetical protein
MTTSTLVLYDTTGQWGWLGELYAIMPANLASHFGSWTAMPVASYKTGHLKQYTAAIYVGSTYDEPLPTAFLDDVYATTLFGLLRSSLRRARRECTGAASRTPAARGHRSNL